MTPRRSATKPCNIDELPDGEVFLAGGGELNLEVTAQELTQLSMELSNAGLTEQEVSVLLSEDNYSYSFLREDSDQEIPIAGHDMDLSCIEPSISISHQSAPAAAASPACSHLCSEAAAASPASSHLCSEAAAASPASSHLCSEAAAAAAASPASSHLCSEAAAASPASSHLCSEAAVAASPASSHLCSAPASPNMGSPRGHRHCVTPESSPLTLVLNHTRSPQPSPRPSSRKRSAQSDGGNTPKRERKGEESDDSQVVPSYEVDSGYSSKQESAETSPATSPEYVHHMSQALSRPLSRRSTKSSQDNSGLSLVVHASMCSECGSGLDVSAAASSCVSRTSSLSRRGRHLPLLRFLAESQHWDTRTSCSSTCSIRDSSLVSTADMGSCECSDCRQSFCSSCDQPTVSSTSSSGSDCSLCVSQVPSQASCSTRPTSNQAMFYLTSRQKFTLARKMRTIGQRMQSVKETEMETLAVM